MKDNNDAGPSSAKVVVNVESFDNDIDWDELEREEDEENYILVQKKSSLF